MKQIVEVLLKVKLDIYEDGDATKIIDSFIDSMKQYRLVTKDGKMKITGSRYSYLGNIWEDGM